MGGPTNHALDRVTATSIRRRIALGAVFAVALAISLRLLHGHSDLIDYLNAARDLVVGEFNVYRSRAPTGTYPYPHFFLLPLAGMLTVLSETAIRFLFALGLAAATVWILVDLERLMRRYGGMRWWHWALFGSLLVRTFTTSYRHGNLSPYVSAFMLHGVLLIGQRRNVSGGIWLGLAAALKLTPALFLIALAATARWRAFGAMFGTMVLCVVLLPLPFLGWQEHTRHMQDFADAIILPRFGIETATQFGPDQSMSIQGALLFALQEQPPTDQGDKFSWLHLDDGAVSTVIAVWSILLAGICAWGFYRPRDGRSTDWYERAAVVMLAMALFSPLTRSYHLTGIALTGAMFCRAAWPRRQRLLFWLPFALLAGSMTFRQKWLIGRDAWWFIDHLGFAHLGLVALACWFAFGPRLARQSAASFDSSAGTDDRWTRRLRGSLGDGSTVPRPHSSRKIEKNPPIRVTPRDQLP